MENQKMDLILQKLGGIEGGLASVREDVRSLQGDMQTIKGDVQTIKGDVQTLKEDVQTLKDRVTNIEITLENETNRNIQLIAEGHLNLDRKLNEALKELQPNTMYHLKVNHLDGEVTKMKRMLNGIKRIPVWNAAVQFSRFKFHNNFSKQERILQGSNQLHCRILFAFLALHTSCIHSRVWEGPGNSACFYLYFTRTCFWILPGQFRIYK